MDFAVLVRASDDTIQAPASLPGRVERQTPPAPHRRLRIGVPQRQIPNFSKQNEHDWVLDLKVGDFPSIILAGKVEG